MLARWSGSGPHCLCWLSGVEQPLYLHSCPHREARYFLLCAAHLGTGTAVARLHDGSTAAQKILLGSSALLWGLATSVKWLALVGFVLCIGHFLLLQVRPVARSTTTLHWHSSTLLAPLGAWQFWVFTPPPIWVVICCLICSPRILILLLRAKPSGSCSTQFPPSMAIRVARGNGRCCCVRSGMATILRAQA